MIDLYSANTPNGKKISIMLEEIGFEYKVIKVDINSGEQFKKELKSLRSRRGTGIKAVADSKVPLTAEISDSATPVVAKKRISSKLVF